MRQLRVRPRRRAPPCTPWPAQRYHGHDERCIARSSPEDRGSRTLALELDLVRKQDDPLTAVEVHGEQLASEVLGAVRPASPPLRAERFHPGTRSGALTGNVSLERLTWPFSFSDSGARHRRQIEP